MTDTTTELVTIELPDTIARELVDVLQAEVEFADEIHQTEKTMTEAARRIRGQLTDD